MLKIYYAITVICLFSQLKADHGKISNSQLKLVQYSGECNVVLEAFAQKASKFTLCTILHSRPITLCEDCVGNYTEFRDKYRELLDTVVNGTSCSSVFLSQDRLNPVQQYHDNILHVWNMGKCNDCFNWTKGNPLLKNDITTFYKMYNETNHCINTAPDRNEVCNKCMPYYEKLDDFYKSLSSDSIGVDSVCMDVVDSMNATRSLWSKTLNCCNLRRTPELVFLSCAGIISFLPILYYISVRFCGPIRDLPNVLKQSRFKQTILRGLSIDSRSD